MKFLNKRRFIVCVAAVGIIGAASSVALAEDTTSLPTSGVVNGTGAINDWGQCVSGVGGILPVFGKILPAPGQSKLDFMAENATAVVYNGSTTDKTVTLATYKEYYKHENYDDVFSPTTGAIMLFGQRINDYEEVVIKPGQFVTLTAQMPWCPTQVDLFCGKAVNYLGGVNRFLQRKLAWYHAHSTKPGWWCDMPCSLKMVDITGVTEGQKVEPGTKLTLGATTNGRTPYAVRFTLEGSNGLVSTNDDLRTPYSFNGDTTALPEGEYTLTASVFDTIRYENNRSCDTKTVHFKIVRVHSYKAGFKPNDYCTLSADMDVMKNTILTTPQWINVPAWVETYNGAGQKEGGLSVKVSSSWSVVHPMMNSNDALEIAAAKEMGCPTGMPAGSSCDTTGQETQVVTSATNGRADFSVKVWWPGIMPTYANPLPHYLDLTGGQIMDDSVVNEIYVQYMKANYPGIFDQNSSGLIPVKFAVEDHYGMMVAGGANGNFPVDNLGQPGDLTSGVSWNPPTNLVIAHGKSLDYQRDNGCTLTLVPNSMQ